MCLRVFVFLYLILSFYSSSAQLWQWSTKNYYTGKFPKLVQKDQVGNLYLVRTGHFKGTDLDTITRMTPTGNILLSVPMPASLEVTGLSVTADNGVFAGGLCFGTRTSGSYTYAARNTDMWVARYDSTGALLWFKTFGSKGVDRLSDLATKGNEVVISGFLSDSTDFGGTVVPKAASRELFVAILNGNGSYLASKIAVNTATPCPWSTSMCFGVSEGAECETDLAGNIYVLSDAEGQSMIDTFLIATWSPVLAQTQHPGRNRCVIKLNSSLQVQSVTRFQQCVSMHGDCGIYHCLAVAPAGDAYLLYHNNQLDYFNTGENTTIYHLNTNGILSHTFMLTPPGKESQIRNMDLDSCGNVYFTGYSRYNSFFYHYVLTNGKLSPTLGLKWLVQDSSSLNNLTCSWLNLWTGRAIVALKNNDCFVGGTFTGTVQLTNPISTGCNETRVFFGRLTGAPVSNCAEANVGFAERDIYTDQLVYPNPTTGVINVRTSLGGGLVTLRNAQGQIVRVIKGVDSEFSVEQLPDGMYIATLINPDQRTWLVKIVVRH